MTLKIRGLVKAYKTFRQALQVGLAPDEMEPFRTQVQALVSQVESICAAHGVTPDDLPTPSRNAYTFLRQLDLSVLPERDGSAGPVPGTLQISHVVKTGKQLSARLWQRAKQLEESDTRRNTMISQIERHCHKIESICEQHETTPAALETPSRQMYCWLKFLTDDEHMYQHVSSLLRAEEAAAPYLKEIGGAGLEISMYHMSSLWRMNAKEGVVRLRCSQGFLHASDEIWEAMFGMMLSRKTNKRKQLINGFTDSETFASVMFDLESVIEREHRHKGVAHDLLESFERVNEGYFSNEMQQPFLTWSQTPTATKYGHYQAATDTVMLSTTLDREEVPGYVVDFVMYHELLHKLHGVEVVDGRRMVHTAAFRRDEKKFSHYYEAELFLERWNIQFFSE